MTYPMLDILMEGAIAFGPERQTYYCNDAFSKMFGISESRLFSGRPLYEFVTFSDENIFLMPNGSGGEDDVMRYRRMQFATHAGKKGDVHVAITPTRETFAKSTLWFAYFYKDAGLSDETANTLKALSKDLAAIAEKCGSLQPEDLANAFLQVKKKLDGALGF